MSSNSNINLFLCKFLTTKKTILHVKHHRSIPLNRNHTVCLIAKFSSFCFSLIWAEKEIQSVVNSYISIRLDIITNEQHFHLYENGLHSQWMRLSIPRKYVLMAFRNLSKFVWRLWSWSNANWHNVFLIGKQLQIATIVFAYPLTIRT